MEKLTKFKTKVIMRFSEQLTDQVFLMIQNDKELMNDYLHVVSKHANHAHVNSEIAKEVKKRFDLKTLSKKNKTPKSVLIQSFEKLEVTH